MLKQSFRRFLLLLVVLVGGFNPSFSQDVSSANWFFGSNPNSIQFTRPLFDAEVITLPNTLGSAGGAVATDPVKSQVLFYTDGINVYNQNDVLLNAGTPLAGSTTRNQGTAICHDPADPEMDNSRILIFTINDAGIISQSAFDKSNSFSSAFPLPPDGAMAEINSPANLPGTVLSDGMVIIPNSTETGFWLITHNAGQASYNITQIDNAGIATIAQTTIAGSPTTVNNLTYHRATNRIGVSPGNGENIVLLDIDLATGAISDSGIDLSFLSSAGSSVYDMDWITSGDSLYVSGDFGNATDNLFRVNLLATPIDDSSIDTVLTVDVNNSFGLQYGPDGFLYHLYEAASDGEFKIGRVEIPDTTDIRQIIYNPIAFREPTTFNDIDFQARQFPSFLPRYDLIQNIDFTFSGTCANVPTYFFPQVVPDIDAIQWDFGDMQGAANGISPNYTYVAAGPFDVSMTVTINGVPRTVTKTITIQDFELTLQIDPMQQYWCPEDFPVSYTATATGANGASAIIRWSNQTAAEANATTAFDEAGTYYVVATDPATGCEAYMEQQVIEYGTVNNFANAWYFGSNAGIDFNPLFDQDDPDFGTIQPIPPGDPDFLGGNLINFGPDNDLAEGFAIFCDQGGKPLVYSNGMEVYNRDNDLVEANLGGDPLATQSVFITQNPADATIYYIFYTKEVPNAAGSYEFGYAIFDLKLRNGGGDMARATDGTLITTTLFNCNTERITGNGAWVVVHEFGNNNFRSYPITTFGVGSPVISNVGRSHQLINGGSTARGYMKLNGTRLGVAISESLTDNFIDLFNFDLTTGAVTENLVLDIANETGEVYGLEFSTENIFATLRNSNGGTKILWWDLIDNTVDPTVPLDEAAANASIITVTDQNAIDLGAMQIGPDGVLYIANSGASNLASIGNPDTEPTDNASAEGEVNFTLSAPPALQARSTIGLPNFVDFNGSSQPQPSLQVNDGCQGDNIDLTVVNPLQDPDREIENYVVIIIDPNGTQLASIALDDENPSTTFGQTQLTGVYQAEFYILNECNNNVIQSVLTFTINELPRATIVSTTQPSDCGLNDGTATIDLLTAGGLTYSVSGATAVAAVGINGPANSIVIPNLSAGAYSLNVTANASGCRSTFPFTIDDPVAYQVQLVEASAADCNDENGLLSFSFTGGNFPTNYTWTIRNQANNSFVESGDETSVPATSLGAGTYTITVLDSDGCTVVGEAEITSPSLIAISTDPGPFSACDAADITINVTTDGAQPIELREIIGNVISDTPANNFSVLGDNDSIRVSNPAAGSGIYNYAVVAPGDLDGPCTNFVTISVSFGTSSPSPYRARVAICPDEVIFDRTFASFDNQPAGFQSVRWFNANGTEIIQTSPTDSVTNVAGYFYSIDGSQFYTFNTERVVAELTNLEGCITTSEINVIEDCQARINAPTAFSPNGDGINDGFILFPFLVDEEDFEFFLFNRWGELIFQTDDLRLMTEQGGWNGSYNNDTSRPLPGGGYAYKVVFKNSARPEEGTQEQRGGVTLIR